MNKLSPIDYFKRCITEKYVDFDSRARRAEYWYFRLFMFISFLPFVFILICGAALESEILILSGIGLIALLSIGFILPSLSVTIRRLHDTNKSGWFYLIAFVPAGGIILFVFTVIEGDRRSNLYGPDPKALLPPDLTDHLQQRY